MRATGTGDNLAGLRVVVTGGAGFLGSHLTEHLVALGADPVVVVDDLSTGSRDNLSTCAGRTQLVEIDVLDPAVGDIVRNADVVFHLAVRNVRASLRHPQENLRVNAMGTVALLHPLVGTRTRFVYVSSSEVYGIQAGGVFSEDVVPAPTTVYAVGKLAGEHATLAYHRTYGLDTRVIRPFNVFGPRSHFEGDSGEVIPKFILRALAGLPLLIHGEGRQTRDFTFVKDMAGWIVRVALGTEFSNEVVNLGGGTETSIVDLADRVRAVTGREITVEHVEPRPGDLPRLKADVTRARSRLTLPPPTSLDAGLESTLRYFEAQDVERLLEAEIERPWD
ncbi:MAG: UDP-glucose 4-epimerase [Actinomycetota bacterium]|nr:UDP-glucose 4-epimerase [Actinomycetota bacterium]